VEPILTENADRFLAKAKTDAEWILGSYGPKEHDVCMAMKLPNGGHFNQVFKQMGVPYTLWPMPVTDAFMAATKKRKANASRRMAAKKAKVALMKKMSVLKIIWTKSRLGLRYIKPASSKISFYKNHI
jgi:hypothetical protein